MTVRLRHESKLTRIHPCFVLIAHFSHRTTGIKIGHEDPTCNVVCKCEKVTEAEIVDAIHRPLPCLSTQAVRKRTRAGMGHCQGEFCEPRVKEILARENRLPVSAVQGRPWPASSLLPRRWLTDEDKEMLCKIGGESKK